MLLQWHITGRCDHACRHCYQDDSASELSSGELIGILDQFRDMIRHLRNNSPHNRIPAHISITGGEPFLRDDFFDLLESFHSLNTEFSYAILTSGSRIDTQAARQLAILKPGFVQLSLDGSPETHDAIRGVGDHAKVVAAIRCLKAAGVAVFISFTAHKMNFRDFAHVAQLGRKLGVQRVWADRFVPIGGAAGQHDMVLSPAETDEFLNIMSLSRKKGFFQLPGNETTTMLRALQFRKGHGRPYRCQAGKNLVTVMPDGTVVPCRRMPVPAGNLMERNLTDIYLNAPLFKELREEKIPPRCAPCFYRHECNGGLRCLSHAIHGTFNNSDPGCSLQAIKFNLPF